MKKIKLFEEYINEEKALRIKVEASLWNGKKPISRKDHGDVVFLLFSQPITDDQTWGNLLYGQPGLNLLVFQIVYAANQNQYWFKIGSAKGSGQPNDTNEDSTLYSTYGNNFSATAEEMKNDPKGVAKKAAVTFMDAKRGMDMNLEVGTKLKRAIFKIANDLDKPLLELIEFAIKNI